MKIQLSTTDKPFPIVWRLYRFGLVMGGLAWVCIATTLCGCGNVNGWVMNQSGRGYYHRGNYQAARYEFERALLDSPYNATYAYNVAKAMQKEGDFAGAEQMYQHAMTLDPSHQPAYRGMSELLIETGRPDDARQLLTAWAQTQPYSAASHVELARLDRELGNYAAAEQELNTALKIRPRFRQALNERARLALVTGGPAVRTPYAELAVASQPQMAARPQISGEMASRSGTSGALQMASTMKHNDPTMNGGFTQVGYAQQMNGMTANMPTMANPQMMMSNSPAQPHQTQMIPGNQEMSSGWTYEDGTPVTDMPMPSGLPAPTPSQPGFGGISQGVQPGMQTQEGPAVELGQPIPVTQTYPVQGMPNGGQLMNGSVQQGFPQGQIPMQFGTGNEIVMNGSMGNDFPSNAFPMNGVPVNNAGPLPTPAAQYESSPYEPTSEGAPTTEAPVMVGGAVPQVQAF